jgi:hypothetical protein
MEVQGGVRRDGWYWGGTGNGKLLRKGTPGRAEIKKIAPMYESAQYDVTLEVQPPGGAPYELQGLFNVDDSLYKEAKPGVNLPVKIHPDKPTRVAIDWDAWRAERRAASQ